MSPNPETAFVSQRPQSLRLVPLVAVVVGLIIMGDSLMYGLLPLEAERLGIALPLVGVLLSANRLVRLVSNTWAGALFSRFGPRWPFFGAVVLGLMTTVVYGLGWGFVAFLLARAGWGVAWSGLRQGGYDAVWLGAAGRRGRLMGILWGVVRLGSAVSVLVGGFLRDNFGYGSAVGFVVAMGVLALPLAFWLPWPRQATFERQTPPNFATGWRMALRTAARRWVLAAGFVSGTLEGVLVSTAALFVTQKLGAVSPMAALGVGIGTVAGGLLAVRFTADLIFGPLFGTISDKIGQANMALLLAVVQLTGLLGAVNLSGGWMAASLAIVFVCGAGMFVTLSAASSHVAARSDHPYHYVGAYTTFGDAGMALGPLLAYSAGGVIGLPGLYVGGGVLLALVIGGMWRTLAPFRAQP